MATVLRRPTASSPSTHLDSVVSDLPWADGFDIGSGVNAVTGEVLGHAIAKPTLTQSQTKSVHYSYQFISTESELEQEIEVSAKGQYNMDGVNLSASASYINQIKFSDTSVTLVARYQSTFDGYDEASSYSLTSAAAGLITNVDKFRSTYGDYFVAAERRGSRFIAVYRCDAKSAERLDKFKAEVGGDAPEIFSAEGSASFKHAAKNNDVTIDIRVDAVGFHGSLPNVPQDPEQILALLQWFIQNEVGVPVRAKLYHYSQLAPAFPADVPIAPAVFVALGQLYLTHWKIVDGLASLPQTYQRQYGDRVSSFQNELTANATALATDQATRDKLTHEADALYDDLRAVLDRQDFYYKVLAQIGREPKQDDLITCVDCGPKSWLYGFSSYNQSRAVNIQTIEQKYYHDAVVSWVVNHTFHVDPDQSRLIVGWEIRANLDRAGEWKKTCDQIILRNSADVWAQSNYWGAFDWTLHVYYVESKDYQFGE